MTEPENPIWAPKLFDKQWLIYNTRKRIVLADGSRGSGKTIAVCHKVMRHMTETPGAQVGVFATSIKAAADCGSWQLLHRDIIPEWLDAKLVGDTGQPVEYISENWEGEKGPKRNSNTRSEYFTWRNAYGGESAATLFSINNINEIAAIVKQKNFSMVWLMELSTWKEIDVMYYTLPTLRMKHLMAFDGTPQNFHQWIADTNPDEVLGARSWFYQFFYVMRNKPPTEDTPDAERKRRWLANMDVIQMFHWDNPHITEQFRSDLEFACHGNKALLDSHFHGIHGEGGFVKERHFASVFVKSKHVIGVEGEDYQIDLDPNTTDLLGGWDLGGVYHGVVLLEQVMRVIGGIEKPVYHVLDELLNLGDEVSLDDCANIVMKQMASLDERYKKEFKWDHWSDDSATTVWRPSVAAFDYQIILAASHGKILLNGVQKPARSVQTRVQILKTLLKENRIYVSSKCVHVIAMIENLRRDPKEYVVREHEYVHIFDALTYPLFSLWQDEMSRTAFAPTASKEEESSSIISV